MEKNFPADVLVEILHRMHHHLSYDKRDLIALKSVSKFWNHVISTVYIPMISPPNPCAPFWGLLCFEDQPPPPPPRPLTESERFNHHHYRPHNPTTSDKFLKLHFVGVGRFLEDLIPRLVRCDPTIEHQMLSLIPEELELERDPTDIRDCCNGLLLILYHHQYYVGNPVTKQRLSIPLNPNHLQQQHTTARRHSSLVFDPSLTHNFKIVTFNGNAGADHLELDIFCSETWGWSTRVIPTNNFCIGIDTWLPHSVYFNRALYSMSQAMYLVCVDNIIAKGDDHSLRACAIELPDRDRDGQSSCCGCIGSSLGCFYYSNRNKQGCSILVWMLVDFEWVLTHNISIKDDIVPPVIGRRPRSFWTQHHLYRVCGFFPNDEAVFISTPRLIFSYHLKTKVAKEWHKPLSWRCNRKTLHSNWIFPFSPCLLLLNHGLDASSFVL